jgi:hypothetical protein
LFYVAAVRGADRRRAALEPLYPFHEHVFPRFVLLAIVLMLHEQYDRFSMDALVKRRRRQPL